MNLLFASLMLSLLNASPISMTTSIAHNAQPSYYDLSFVIVFGDLDIVKYLIEVGKVTPTADHLNWAIFRDKSDIAKYLMNEGIVMPTEHHLKTAIRKGNSDVVKYLVKERILIPTKEHVQLAIQSGKQDIVNFLRSWVTWNIGMMAAYELGLFL